MGEFFRGLFGSRDRAAHHWSCCHFVGGPRVLKEEPCILPPGQFWGWSQSKKTASARGCRSSGHCHLWKYSRGRVLKWMQCFRINRPTLHRRQHPLHFPLLRRQGTRISSMLVSPRSSGLSLKNQSNGVAAKPFTIFYTPKSSLHLRR